MKAEELADFLAKNANLDIGFTDMEGDYLNYAENISPEELKVVKEHYIKVSKDRIKIYENFIREIE